MRTVTKTLTLPVGEEPKTFRLTKLDAFSGARVLQLLHASSADDLSAFLLSLPEDTLTALMRTCLRHAEISLPAGFIRVWDQGCWGLPELEYETLACYRLTQEVLAWTLEDFFPAGGQPS